MANQEHVAILRRSVQEWNRWRFQYPDIPPELQYIDLNHAELMGADFLITNLSGTNLSFANLSNAHLFAANLSNSDLSSAILMSAELTGADLSEAKLIDANLYTAALSNANLNGANLSNSNLSGANLNGANLSGANLNNAIFGKTVVGNVNLQTVNGLDTIQHRGPSTLGTNTLECSQGNIPEVFLRGVGLSDTFIEYACALVQKPINYYTCFISYSSKDEMFAKQLYNDLQGEGVRCWFAPEDMDIGDKIKHRIDASIRMYNKLLLILSEHSIHSTWVAYEVERALNKEPAGVPNVLYPVRLDKTILTCDMEWAKDIKDTRHIGNFEESRTNHDAYQDSFKRLLRALQSNDTTNKTGR